MTTTISTGWAASATGETLCHRGLIGEGDYHNLRWRTGVVLGGIANPVLRDVLVSFSELLEPATRCQWVLPMELPAHGSWYADIDLLARHPVTIWTALDDLVHPSAPPLAVGAVGYIQRTLGLTLKQTLKAAQIRPRTYHSWQEHPDRNPRLTSLGRLWQLHQLTEDLDETMGAIGVRQWLAQDRSRLITLLRGRFDELAAAVSGSHSGGQDAAQNFEGALDERDAKLRIPRHPITGLKMNPADVAALEK
jgi:hypothetical protein